MTGATGGILLIVVGVGMVVFARRKKDVERAFARSYLLFVGYTMTSMALIVLGIAWLIQAIGAAQQS
jgi:hypothetical protein